LAKKFFVRRNEDDLRLRGFAALHQLRLRLPEPASSN